jgi:hypothetical protein
MAPAFFASLASVSHGRVISFPGGVLIRATDGEIVEAVGISGDYPDNDEACAVFGIERVGLLASLRRAVPDSRHRESIHMTFDARDLYKTPTVLRHCIVLLHRHTIVLGITNQDDQSFGRPATDRGWCITAQSTFTFGRRRHVSFGASGVICPSYVFGSDFDRTRDLLDTKILSRPLQARPQGSQCCG